MTFSNSLLAAAGTHSVPGEASATRLALQRRGFSSRAVCPDEPLIGGTSARVLWGAGVVGTPACALGLGCETDLAVRLTPGAVETLTARSPTTLRAEELRIGDRGQAPHYGQGPGCGGTAHHQPPAEPFSAANVGTLGGVPAFNHCV